MLRMHQRAPLMRFATLLLALLLGVGLAAAETSASDLPLLPEPTEIVQPRYPKEAQERELEGWVGLAVTIGEGGVVTDVRVLIENPAGYRFGEVAAASVRQWKNANTPPGTYRLRVNFKL
ncbi:hypothetical protein sos41_31750 [Alphaproteobacteria bacterium SO-S41]|nr:hypothetical protein sos41_31750 [Alphaproteobacteria bacterium SO-S41]